jgi:hypothetical protein
LAYGSSPANAATGAAPTALFLGHGLDPEDRMVGRLRKLLEEEIHSPALLGTVESNEAITFRANDLYGSEGSGGALEAELAVPCRPQVPHPVRLSTATYEVADAVNLERTTKGHRPRLSALTTGHDEDQRAAEVLQDRVHQVGHHKPGANVARSLRVH